MSRQGNVRPAPTEPLDYVESLAAAVAYLKFGGGTEAYEGCRVGFVDAFTGTPSPFERNRPAEWYRGYTEGRSLGWQRWIEVRNEKAQLVAHVRSGGTIAGVSP